PGQALTYLARIDRRLTRTSFGNEPSSPTIAYFKTGLSTLATDTVRHGFRTAQALGAAGGSIASDSVYVVYDGPRTDVPDTTRFWPDRFGAPRRIVNAL